MWQKTEISIRDDILRLDREFDGLYPTLLIVFEVLEKGGTTTGIFNSAFWYTSEETDAKYLAIEHKGVISGTAYEERRFIVIRIFLGRSCCVFGANSQEEILEYIDLDQELIKEIVDAVPNQSIHLLDTEILFTNR
jgi:hypothetical protein